MKFLCGKSMAGPGESIGAGDVGGEKTCETCLRLATSKKIIVETLFRPRASWSWHVQRFES